jgi:hypothetical protein
MKLTNKQIFESIPILKSLQEKDLPLEFQFYLGKLIPILENLQTIFLKLKDKLILKYCKKDESGCPIKTGTDMSQVIILDAENLNKDFSILENIENEIDVIQIGLEVDFNISIKDLEKISWLYRL